MYSIVSLTSTKFAISLKRVIGYFHIVNYLKDRFPIETFGNDKKKEECHSRGLLAGIQNNPLRLKESFVLCRYISSNYRIFFTTKQ
jgi:hypothetical protein